MGCYFYEFYVIGLEKYLNTRKCKLKSKNTFVDCLSSMNASTRWKNYLATFFKFAPKFIFIICNWLKHMCKLDLQNWTDAFVTGKSGCVDAVTRTWMVDSFVVGEESNIIVVFFCTRKMSGTESVQSFYVVKLKMSNWLRAFICCNRRWDLNISSLVNKNISPEVS